ncbi:MULTISPECIES: discoidin domain-containing protein [unclassified Cryobacterium]|uniref:discoidin domain-containing protein n=1 Tax=unclassified Cryobacterium TaxID=2649013 RepID=UPI0013049BDB|nr:MULTISPECIES: discoidin domain-containing protein [unclassified Cryobacterium]
MTASEQETTRESGGAANMLDGNLTTIWHSQYSPTLIPFPHSIVLDVRAINEVSGFTYTPRSGTSRNGAIGQYAIAVSSDGTSWSAPVASGIWADNSQAKALTFPAVQARYVRLTATTEAGNRGQWTTAAALLPGNKVLTWFSYSNTTFGGANGKTQTAILALNTGVVTPLTVANTGHDMFCPGVSILPDGRILISGGSNAASSTIYDPATTRGQPPHP